MEAKEREARGTATPAPVPPTEEVLLSSSQQFTAGKKHKRLGMVLKGRYRIESLVASGGMSDVYRATDRHLEEAGVREVMVAVKILRHELTRDRNALSLLAREAAKSKRLSHPNIIRVYDLDHDGDTWFMVMELLDGEPLSRVIQRAKPNGLTWKGGRAVLAQVVSALAFSHKHGIVHADLKPSNVFLTRQGEIKLLDFGVAQALKPHQHIDFLNPSQDDETTIYGYTPAYASASLIAGNDPTVRDDLYALACIAFELLSSRHPFERKKLSVEERGSYKLHKPKNMPLGLWRIIRELLKSESAQASLSSFQSATRPADWEKRLYPAGLAVAALVAILSWYGAFIHSRDNAALLQARQDRAALLSDINSRVPSQLLAALDELTPIEKAGVLRLQKARLMADFSHRMDEALQAPGRPNLPNIPAARKVLAQAQALYPHDERLLNHGEQLLQRNLSLQAALSQELQGRLDQGAYKTFPALEELANLKTDLMFLSNEPPAPSELAVQVFARQLSDALGTDDGPALARLLKVANLFFDSTPSLQENLSRARNLEDAIETLGQYHKAVAAGGNPSYPASAAKRFYQQRFDTWRQGIENAGNSRDLDKIYADVLRLQDSIPIDFEPLAALRQRLADAYLNQADQLLDRRRARQAQPLMQKATVLMRGPSEN